MKNKQDRNNSLAILNGFIFYHIIGVCVCVGVRLCGCAFVWMCTSITAQESRDNLPVLAPPSTMGSQIEVTSSGLRTKPSCWASVDLFQSPPPLYLDLFTLALKALS